MLRLQRTNSDDPSFHQLVQLLDKELWAQYEEEMKNYAPHNKIEDNKNVVIAYLNDTAVGCGCFKKFDDMSVEIKRMYVEKSFRGKRIGEAVLKELEHWAKESGYSSTVLETGTKQVKAIRLYERCGYIRTENYGPYVDLQYSVCMRKEL
jgi:putative acetyltransferase